MKQRLSRFSFFIFFILQFVSVVGQGDFDSLIEDPQIVSYTSLSKKYYYNGTSININIETTGGNKDGWEFIWPTGVTKSSEYTYVTNTNGELLSDGSYDNSFVVSVRNYGPDGKTLDFTQEIEFIIYTYPTPILNLEHNFYSIGEGENIAIEPIVSGGNPSTWSYKWLLNDEVVSTNSTLEIVGENKTLAAREDNYKLVATNTLNEGVDIDKKELEFIVRVDGLSFAWANNLPKDVVEGDEIVAEFTQVGGDNYQWNYLWSNDMTPLTGNEQRCVFLATRGEKEGRSSVLEMQASCDGFSYTMNHPFTVWSVPSIQSVSSENIELYHNQIYQFEIQVEGGLPSGWSYEWYLDDIKIPNANTTSYSVRAHNTENEPKVHTYKVVARNVTNEKSRQFEKIFKTTVWKTPSVLINDKYIQIGEGENIVIEPIVSGGNPLTWSYKWLLNDEVVSTNSTLEIVGENKTLVAREDNYKLVATNTLNEGVDIDKKELEFIVRVDGLSFAWANNLPKNVVEGDEIVAEFTQVGGDNYQWNYLWSNDMTPLTGNEQRCVFLATRGEKEGRSSVLEMQASCDGFSYTMNHPFTVWSMPSAQIISADDIVILHNQIYQFEIQVEGGLPSGWSYEWYLDGIKIPNANTTSFSVRAHNTGNEVKHHVYKVVAINITNEIAREFEFEFKVEVWPAVSKVTHNPLKIDLYDGSSIELGVDIVGGCANGWVYEWTIEDKVFSINSTCDYTAKVLENENSTTEFIKLKMMNLHDKSPFVLYEQEVTFELTSWTHGEIKDFEYDVHHYRSGDPIKVSVTTEGGYPNWTYSWYYNDELIHQSTSSVFTYTAQNNYSETSVLDNIRVVAKNTIPQSGDSKSDNVSKSFAIWPVVEFAEDFSISARQSVDDINIYKTREGNKLVLNVERATGGYNANSDFRWEYVWYEDGNVVKSSSSIGKESYSIEKITVPNSAVKTTTTKEFGLKILNYSPYGDIWYDKEYIPKSLKVYARPQIPERLMVKGNGNSNTLVCLMGLTDNELSEREYNFIFGYTDINGVDHFMEPIKNRWYQFESNVSIKNSNNKFWVCTQWDYDNENKVTSGRIFLNGSVDNEFDGSCFDNMYVGIRGNKNQEITGVHEIKVDKLELNNKQLVIDINAHDDSILRIYSIEGKCIKEIHLNNDASYNNRIDLSNYPSGIYIVNLVTGKISENRKIYVP